MTKVQLLLQVQGDTLLVANAGDSRCVVSEGGKAVAMSFDHKPTDEKEHSRIIKVSLLLCFWLSTLCYMSCIS